MNNKDQITNTILNGPDEIATEAFEKFEKLEKKERTANLDNLRRVVKVCVDNRIEHIKYGDVEVRFMPEKMEFPEEVRQESIEPQEKAFNPDYLIDHPPTL